jgi:hypothetical protein
LADPDYLSRAPTGAGIAISLPKQIALDAPNIVTTNALTNNGVAVGNTHAQDGVTAGDETSGLLV